MQVVVWLVPDVWEVGSVRVCCRMTGESGSTLAFDFRRIVCPEFRMHAACYLPPCCVDVLAYRGWLVDDE
jgi:hypothetical protein